MRTLVEKLIEAIEAPQKSTARREALAAVRERLDEIEADALDVAALDMNEGDNV